VVVAGSLRSPRHLQRGRDHAGLEMVVAVGVWEQMRARPWLKYRWTSMPTQELRRHTQISHGHIGFPNLGRRWVATNGTVCLPCPAGACAGCPSIRADRFGQPMIIWVGPLEIPLEKCLFRWSEPYLIAS
jgi:hypothetical protein